MRFTDQSWHNDSCPTFINAAQTLRVWIEHPDADKRETPGQNRYAVEKDDFNPDTYVPSFNPNIIHEGSDWRAVLACIAENT
jgi:hypothetical protein